MRCVRSDRGVTSVNVRIDVVFDVVRAKKLRFRENELRRSRVAVIMERDKKGSRRRLETPSPMDSGKGINPFL
jgi:hypothetical protein